MSLAGKLLNLLRIRSLDREIDEEIRFHLDERTRQYQAGNIPAEDAVRLAHDRFGSINRAKTGMRAARLPGRMAFAAAGMVALMLVSGFAVKRWRERSRVYELNGEITAPIPVLAPSPHYTDAARLAKIQGVVRLQCVVRTDGGCGDATVLRSLDSVYGLDDEAVRTMRRWRFKPALLERQPVPVRIRIDMKFALR